jgi:hypothetical protein
MEETMKRLASIAFLGLTLLAPALLSGCGEETKTDAAKPADTKPADKPADKPAEKPAG